MKSVLTGTEIKNAERFTMEDIGISSDVLMEKAALSVLSEIKKRYFKGRVLAVAGPGNNGGDALALTRLLLQEGFKVCLLRFGTPGEMNRLQYDRLIKVSGFYRNSFDELGESDLNAVPEDDFDIIIDGAFGIGMNRPMGPEYRGLFDKLNSLNAFKIALDIPSGLNPDTGECGISFNADLTVTFGFYKKGLFLGNGPDKTGQVALKEIGIMDEKSATAKAFEKYDLKHHLPIRTPVSHKGTYGKSLLVTGSRDIYGACFLSAKACFMTGAGMVKIFTHESNVYNLEREIPEAMISSYNDNSFSEERLLKDIEWADTVTVGSGLGMSDVSKRIMDTIILKSDLNNKTLILDADAINILSRNKELFFILTEKIKDSFIECVMTPHKKELKNIIDMLGLNFMSEEDAVKKIFETTRIVIVNKGARTVTVGEEMIFNLSGNDGMATAGSGDVLTGILSGILYQLKERFDFDECVATGVFLHGFAGDRAAKRTSRASLTAGDILNEIPAIFKDAESRDSLTV